MAITSVSKTDDVGSIPTSPAIVWFRAVVSTINKSSTVPFMLIVLDYVILLFT